MVVVPAISREDPFFLFNLIFLLKINYFIFLYMKTVKKVEVRNFINIMFISLSSLIECTARLQFDGILDLFDLKLELLNL